MVVKYKLYVIIVNNHSYKCILVAVILIIVATIVHLISFPFTVGLILKDGLTTKTGKKKKDAVENKVQLSVLFFSKQSFCVVNDYVSLVNFHASDLLWLFL